MTSVGAAAPTPFPQTFYPNANRKRRAPTPDSPFSTTPTWDQTPLAAKRRRPNLANGFSSLSLDSPISTANIAGPSSLPSYSQSQRLENSRKRIDDDDIFDDLGVAYDHNDVSVEEVHPRRTNSSSSDSSDAAIPPLRRRRTRQADEVELPPEQEYINDGVSIEDVTPQNSRKRRSASIEREGPIKRSREEDVDMGDIEEIPRRKKSEWYEPEKDRIIYTSLSSSSRSPSPEADVRSQLIQPGENGFTISPSMLTRLLSTNQPIPPPFPQQREMGLVLYRPLGIPPGNMTQRDVQEIVREWQGRVSESDSGRFENVDEDEVLTLGESAPEGMDID